MAIKTRTVCIVAAALAASLLLPIATQAAMLDFYAVTGSNTVGRLPTLYDFGPITATAGQQAGTPKSLTVANFQYPQPEELGLGVCGSADAGSLCNRTGGLPELNLPTSTWSGDTTEIDNLGNNETLTLRANAGYSLSGQFMLGSLDNNGTTSDYENGYVTYGAHTVQFTRTSTGASITSGNATIVQAGVSFGQDVFLLTLLDFDPATAQVVFGAGGISGTGTNNDYLVASAGYAPVPVPAAAWLLGSGLCLLGSLRRRRHVVA